MAYMYNIIFIEASVLQFHFMIHFAQSCAVQANFKRNKTAPPGKNELKYPTP